MPVYPSTPRFSYPVTRTLEFKTQIVTGADGAEQRWPLTVGEERWTLTYPRLTLAERDTLLDFLDSVRGSADQTIEFTFEGTTYTGLYLDSDSLAPRETDVGARSLTVTLRQVYRTPDAGELATDFPALASGYRVQFPYTHERSYATVANKTDGGRFARSTRDNVLRAWSAGGTVLTDSEAQAIWDHFSRAGGRWKTFGFTDPDSGTRYTNCRFSSDTLEWRYVEKGYNSVECRIEQAQQIGDGTIYAVERTGLWKAKPTQFAQTITADTGEIESMGLYLAPGSPSDPDLQKTVATGSMRIWASAPLAAFPEWCWSGWNFPPGFDRSQVEKIDLVCNYSFEIVGAAVVGDYYARWIEALGPLTKFYSGDFSGSTVVSDATATVPVGTRKDHANTIPSSLAPGSAWGFHSWVWQSQGSSSPDHSEFRRFVVHDCYLLLYFNSIRIKCGGADFYDASIDYTWKADRWFSGGSAVATSWAGGGLYASARKGSAFSYSIPLSTGHYNVTLKMAEPDYLLDGQRVFSVSINGSEVISDLDLHASSGYQVAHSDTFQVNMANDGKLKIDFAASVGEAIISGISISPYLP